MSIMISFSASGVKNTYRASNSELLSPYVRHSKLFDPEKNYEIQICKENLMNCRTLLGIFYVFYASLISLLSVTNLLYF